VNFTQQETKKLCELCMTRKGEALQVLYNKKKKCSMSFAHQKTLTKSFESKTQKNSTNFA
jgi:hypothetical protein